MNETLSTPNISVEAAQNYWAKSMNVTKSENVFNEKNYLNTMLDDGVNEKKIVIRILPNPDNEGMFPFTTVHVHGVQLNDGGRKIYKTYTCLKHTDGINHEKFGYKCPFCEIQTEAYNAALKESDPEKSKALKRVSMANHEREAVIVRCIERGKEDEGVKFWRIKLRLDKSDPFNRIMSLFNDRYNESIAAKQEPCNIFDTMKGYDIILTITRGSELKPGNTISVSDAKFPSPITPDINQLNEWVYDKKKWTDVFGVKPYEYLALISEGREPWFDNTQKKWVDKEEFNASKVASSEKSAEAIAEAEKYFKESVNSSEVLSAVMLDDEPKPQTTYNDEIPF